MGSRALMDSGATHSTTPALWSNSCRIRVLTHSGGHRHFDEPLTDVGVDVNFKDWSECNTKHRKISMEEGGINSFS